MLIDDATPIMQSWRSEDEVVMGDESVQMPGKVAALVESSNAVLAVCSTGASEFSIVHVTARKTIVRGARLTPDGETWTWGAADSMCFVAASSSATWWLSPAGNESQNAPAPGRVVFCGQLKAGCAVARVSLQDAELSWQCAAGGASPLGTWKPRLDWSRVNKLIVVDDFVALVVVASTAVQVWTRTDTAAEPMMACQYVCADGRIVAVNAWLDGVALCVEQHKSAFRVDVYAGFSAYAKPVTLLHSSSSVRTLDMALDNRGRLHVAVGAVVRMWNVFTLEECTEAPEVHAAVATGGGDDDECMGRASVVRALMQRVHTGDAALQESRRSLARRALLAAYLEDAARDDYDDDDESTSLAFAAQLKPLHPGQPKVPGRLPAKPRLNVDVLGAWLEGPTGRLVVQARLSMANGILGVRAVLSAPSIEPGCGQYRWTSDDGVLTCWGAWEADAARSQSDVHLIALASTMGFGVVTQVCLVATVNHDALLERGWVALRQAGTAPEPPPLERVAVINAHSQEKSTLSAWDRARLCAQVRRAGAALELDYGAFASECGEVLDAIEAELSSGKHASRADLAVARLLMIVDDKEGVVA